VDEEKFKQKKIKKITKTYNSKSRKIIDEMEKVNETHSKEIRYLQYQLK
jgi:hypothetical protein